MLEQLFMPVVSARKCVKTHIALTKLIEYYKEVR